MISYFIFKTTLVEILNVIKLTKYSKIRVLKVHNGLLASQ